MIEYTCPVGGRLTKLTRPSEGNGDVADYYSIIKPMPDGSYSHYTASGKRNQNKREYEVVSNVPLNVAISSDQETIHKKQQQRKKYTLSSQQDQIHIKPKAKLKPPIDYSFDVTCDETILII